MNRRLFVDSLGSQTIRAGMSRKLYLVLAFAGWLALGADKPMTAQSFDTVTVDQSSKNNGSLTDALIFGGPLTIQLPGVIPKIGGGTEPRPPYTVAAVTGIASN